MQKPIAPAVQMYGAVRASRIIGESVEDHRREKLGRIRSLVSDAADDCLAHAVLSFGGFMASGTRLFAVPWNACTSSAAERELILNVNSDKLEGAPGFEQDSPGPDFADRTWGLGIHQYCGHGPYWDHLTIRRGLPVGFMRTGGFRLTPGGGSRLDPNRALQEDPS